MVQRIWRTTSIAAIGITCALPLFAAPVERHCQSHHSRIEMTPARTAGQIDIAHRCAVSTSASLAAWLFCARAGI